MQLRQNGDLPVHMDENVVPLIIQAGDKLPEESEFMMGKDQIGVLHLYRRFKERNHSMAAPTGRHLYRREIL